MKRSIVLVTFFGVRCLVAQMPPDLPYSGKSATGTFLASEMDSIDQATGNVNVKVPLAALPPGRAGSGFSLELVYNSALVDSLAVQVGNNVLVGLSPSPDGGWRYSHLFGLRFDELSALGGSCSNVPVPSWRVYRTLLKTPDGSVRQLALAEHDDNNGDGYFGVSPTKGRICTTQGNTESVPTGKMVYFTTDGSYIRVEISDTQFNPACEAGVRFTTPQCRQWQAFLADGSMYEGYGETARSHTDRNGNKVTFASYTDPASPGVVITDIEDDFRRRVQIRRPITQLRPNQPATATDEINYFGFNNLAYTRNVIWATHYIASRMFVCGPSGIQCAYGNADSWGIVSVTFPQSVVNNVNYKLDFEYTTSQGWGELRKILYPTRLAAPSVRPTIEYSYAYDCFGQQGCASSRDTSSGDVGNPVLVKTFTHLDNTSATRVQKWNFTYSPTLSTITLPDGQTIDSSYYDRLNVNEPRRGLVYRVVGPYGKIVNSDWAQNKPYYYCGGFPNSCRGNPYVSEERVTLPGANGASSTMVARKVFKYNKNGALTKQIEYAFDQASELRRIESRAALYTDEASDSSSPYLTAQPNGYWMPTSQLAGRRVLALPLSIHTSGAGGGNGYQEFSYDFNWNQTQHRVWDSTLASPITVPALNSTSMILTGANSITNGIAYNANGTISSTTNPVNGVTSFGYGGSIAGCGVVPLSNVYPTLVTLPSTATLSQTYTYGYDCSSGLVSSISDDARVTTTTQTYDGMNRPRARREAGLRLTEHFYSDSKFITQTFADVNAYEDGALREVRHFDDLGRLSRVRKTDDEGQQPTEDNSEGITVDYLYAPPCRSGMSCGTVDSNSYEAVSNAYRPSMATTGWTRRTIDPLGRNIAVVTFSGDTKPYPWGNNIATTGTSTTSYNGDLVESIDADGHVVRQRRNAIGQLIEVVEDPEKLAYQTQYRYNVQDSLIGVCEGHYNASNVCVGRERSSFSYSSANRLEAATNVENGTVAFTYWPDGATKTRTDQRSITSTFNYDALRRLSDRSYSDSTPVVTLSYDTCTNGKGRLCGTSTPDSSVGLSYDLLGRVVTSQQTTGAAFQFSYTYNLLNEVKSIIYPVNNGAARKISYTYTNAGRVAAVINGEASGNDFYAHTYKYWPNGLERSQVYGNGLRQESELTSKLQLASRKLCLATVCDSSTTVWEISNTYRPNGNVDFQRTSGRQNGAAFLYDQTFTYDGVNRLRSFHDSGIGVKVAPTVDGQVISSTQYFAYDRSGNRALLFPSERPGGALTPTVDNLSIDVAAQFPNNRSQLNSHDVAGNVVTYGNQTNTYDAEGRLSTSTFPNPTNTGETITWTYMYDGNGHRVKARKTRNPGAVELESTIYVYMANGELATERSTAAPSDPVGRVYFHQDALGSSRAVSKPSGTVNDIISKRFDYFPFGEAIIRNSAQGYGSPANPLFTGKERDAGTGLDYFGARYMSAAQGRFTSPDEPLIDQHVSDPQSWNLYSYVRNNPLRYVDPNGFECVTLDGGGIGDDGRGKPCNDPSLNSTHGINVNSNGTSQPTVNGPYPVGPSADGIHTEADALLNVVPAGKLLLSGAKVMTTVGPLIGMAFLKGTAKFVTGQVIKRTIQTEEGPLVMEATLEVIGTTVKLGKLSFSHPDGLQVVTNPGVKAIKGLVDAVSSEFAAAGFTEMKVTALRMTGANAPRVVNSTYKLTGQ